MKKLLFILTLFVSTMAFSQTTIDLSGMTEDVTLGQSCSASQTPEQFVTTGDVNLNGFTLYLRNSVLNVTGNINGGGEIDTCGQAEFCANGAIQNNPVYNSNAYCQTLSTPEFTTADSFSFNNITKIVTIKNSKFIEIMDLQAKVVLYTTEDSLDCSTLSTGVYVFKSDKFFKKILVQ